MNVLRPKNMRLFIAALVMLAAGLTFLGVGMYQVHSSHADESSNQPNFRAVLPEHKTIESLGGWQKLTAPNHDVFYVYLDTINGVDVNVSQQLLPGKFKGNVTQSMLEMARAYNANVTLDADGVTVYVGTSAKGPQSVLFTKNGVLVLMKSWATIPDSDWVAYVKSLL